MYQTIEQLVGANKKIIRIKGDNGLLTFSEFFKTLILEEEFLCFFNSIFLEAEYSAYCFETPSVNALSLKEECQFILIDSPVHKKLRPDWRAFSDKLKLGSESVECFENKSGDATLVVPNSINSSCDYSHLAPFMRNAPKNQKCELWRSVAKNVLKMTRVSPVWLSTAGLGVPWLHVRLSSKPKYYRYEPYKA